MNLRRSIFCFILLATSLFAQNPFATQALYKGLYEGTHANAAVSLRLVSDDARYTGTLSIGSNQYTLQAKPTPGQLTGEFYDESGNAAPFICSLHHDGQVLLIKRDEGNVRLKRVPVPDNIWGHWKAEGIDLYLSQAENSEQVSGMIFFQGGKFPLSGRYELGRLDGQFKTDDQAYPFQVQTKQADRVHFISGPFAQQLTRQTAEPFREAHQALVAMVFKLQDQPRFLPLPSVRRTVIDAHILLEELQNALPRAVEERDGLAWAETVSRHVEMNAAREKLEELHTLYTNRVGSDLLNEGRDLLKQEPTPEDTEKAFELIRQSADLGYPYGMLELGKLYSDGTGTDQNYEQALHWYNLTTKTESSVAVNVAQNNIGLMYYRGEGVTKDLQESIKWLQRAVDNGNTTAVNNLKFVQGHILTLEALEIINNEPSKSDEKKAFELLLEGAEGDYPWAMFYTASNYHRGRGVEQNFDEAMRWYLEVAELNHKTAKVAQNNIGIMYYRGEGVTKDNAEAIKWLQRSADNGHAKAVESLKHIQEQN